MSIFFSKKYCFKLFKLDFSIISPFQFLATSVPPDLLIEHCLPGYYFLVISQPSREITIIKIMQQIYTLGNRLQTEFSVPAFQMSLHMQALFVLLST